MRRRNVAVLVVIWVLVFAAAVSLALLLADDDPSVTDEGAGMGALAVPVGALFSGIYLFFALDVRSRRQRPHRQITGGSGATAAEGTVVSLKRNGRRTVLAVVLWAEGR